MNEGVKIQQLDPTDRVLAVAQIAALRSPDGWFSPQQVRKLFMEIRIPAPADVGAVLSRLRGLELVIHEPKRRHSWALTPLGEDHAGRLGPGSLGAGLNARLGTNGPRAEVGGAEHAVLPPTLAPRVLAAPIARMLEDHPFERSIFCMSRLPSQQGDPGDPLASVIDTLRDAATKHGLRVHVADDRALDPLLFNSVAAYIWSCAHGVAIFEDRVGRGVNANMLLEVGAMAALGRPCLLLRDAKLDRKRIPTDLTGHIRTPVSFDDVDAVGAAVHRWLATDLGFGPCPACPPPFT